MKSKSFDVLVLFVLIIARVQIDTLADSVLPDRLTHVRRLVEGWWPAWSLDRLTHPQTDPVTMMLVVTALGLFAIYMVVDAIADRRPAFASNRSTADCRMKLALVYAIIGLLVIGKSVLLINLRHQSVPWSYSHDGGVIQTEVTIRYFLEGINPYQEDYLNTPMAEWGINEYRTALYHYPYLPWTFVFSTPFYLLSDSLLGWYDQRMVYLLLFILMLFMAQSMAKKAEHKLLVVMLIGLNPIQSVDIIFGPNDPFVLFWVVLALWLMSANLFKANHLNLLFASAAMGLACASKPTAWFLVPFWMLYLLRDHWGEQLIPQINKWKRLATVLLQRVWALPVVMLIVIGPWLVWDAWAMYDDVWRWSSGQGETGYQIWGWGASNYVLAWGLIENRFEYWPFIIPQLVICVPLLLFLLYRQVRNNTLSVMLFNGVLFLFVFAYLSRALQLNYLGFLLSCLVLAYFVDID